MRVGEPLRAFVVEVGERALLQDRGRFLGLRQDAVGIAENNLGNNVDQVGRIEPGVAQFVEALRRIGDGNRARIVRVIFSGDVRCQSFGEGE